MATSVNTVKVPLFSRTYRNVDEVVLTDDGALQYNGFIDDAGGINVRPGEVLAVDTTRRIDSLYSWPENYIVSIEEGSVVLYSVSGNTLVPAFTAASMSYSPTVPVICCNDSSRVFMAGGGKINYVSNVGIVTELADTDAPSTVSHVAFLDGYILAISGSKLYWSDIPTDTSWSALSFATAEGNPDSIVAMVVLQRQIYLIGTVSTEIWENDGSSPFARIPGGMLEVGCVAPYSVVRLDSSLIWLGHNRYFVRFEGRSVEKISSTVFWSLAFEVMPLIS